MKSNRLHSYCRHRHLWNACILCIALTFASCINRADRWTGSPGIILEQDNDVTRVNRIVPETLRGNGTLLEGDILHSVDGQSTAGLTLTDIFKQLKGPVGSTVDVVVLRGSSLVALRLERIMLTDPARRILWIEQLSTQTLPVAEIETVDIPPPTTPSPVDVDPDPYHQAESQDTDNVESQDTDNSDVGVSTPDTGE